MSEPQAMNAGQQQAAPVKENIMGTAPINSLLLKLSIPMMISMLVQALYNVVDSVFVSHVSEDALSAVSLAFPVQTLLIGFAVGTAVGVNALLSKSLGEKNFEQVNRAAVNGLFLAFCSFCVFFLFGVFGVRLFFSSQTNSAAIYQYGMDYLSVVCMFSLGCFMQCMLEKLLTSTGKSMFAMVSQLVGAATNIILDPIMIFGLCGFPRMEARGAAVATVCGQFLGCGVGLAFNLLKNKEIRFDFHRFRPHGPTISRIYSVGAPSIAMQAVGSVMTFSMNNILMGFSSTAVAVFGVYFKLQSFVFMPIFGMNSGMVPIVGYNYGARRPARIVKTIKLSVLYAECIMLAGFLAAQLAPDALLGIFNASPEMLAIGRVCLRIISLCFLMAGFSVISCSVFQAMGKGFYALLVSVGRQLVVLIPVAFLMSLTGNLDAVWFSFPIAEGMSVALCITFLLRINRDILKPMFEEEAAKAV